MNGPAYIVAAARTSVVPCGGGFRDVDYDALAVAPVARCLERSTLTPNQVDELILSNALGAGGNPARVAALASGLPTRVAGLSIDRQCAGGLDAIIMAHALITAGHAEVVLAGGSESYSLRPQRAFRSRWDEAPQPRHQARFTPWPDNDPDMSEAASRLADRDGISLDAQNDWAMASHAKARAASDRLAREIANPDGMAIAVDPFTRVLSPRLCDRATKIVGSITAANACVAADGAAVVAVVSPRVHERLAPDFSLRIIGGRTLGGDPAMPGAAPIDAIRNVLEAAIIDARSLRAVEVMEAYAAQAIACVRGADLNPAAVNLGGGALARGHPIGASGAILMVRLFHELSRTGGMGLAAIASAGGLGTAMLVESIARPSARAIR
jgi:acetyl-CoA C-acetyltransferase